MSIQLDEQHFWLPTDFLNDIFMDNKAAGPLFPTANTTFSLQHGIKKAPPPAAATAVNQSDVSWDMMYAAATKDFTRIQLIEETNGYYQNRVMFAENRNHGHDGHVLNGYKQLPFGPFPQFLPQQQIMMQQDCAFWGMNKPAGVYPQIIHWNPSLSPPPPPPPRPLLPPPWHKQNQQRQHLGFGMRVVFLANTGGNRCAGTGVFLPRKAGSKISTHYKKSGCSAVLIQDKVVQTLNINHKVEKGKTHKQICNSKPKNGDLVISNVGKKVKQEICLPKEWIY